MRSGSVQILALVLLLLAGSTVAEGAVNVVAFEGAGLSETPGVPGGTPLGVGAALAQGDTVVIGTGSTLTLEFDDGSQIDVVGPARFVLSLVSSYARTIDLLEGTIERAVIGDITTGIRTPGGPFLALRNSTGRATVTPLAGDQVQAVFELLEGSDAKVGREGGTAYSIDIGQPESFVSSLTPASGGEGSTSGEGGEYKVGPHTIEVDPEGGFLVEPQPDGGLKITSTVPEGEFGMVTIDGKTRIFMARGETVQFSGAGMVVGTTGIVHVTSDLAVEPSQNFDDPVGDPADSSFTGFKKD